MIKMAYYNDFIRCYSDGRIERIDKRYKNPVWREVKPTDTTRNGYVRFCLYQKKGKSKRELWHRVIWIAFNGEIPNGLTINHKDEIKTNNALDNLELLTRGDNIRYSKNKPVIGINIKTGEKVEFPSAREAEKNGFNHRHISDCCKGKYKQHKGYKWYFTSEIERS